MQLNVVLGMAEGVQWCHRGDFLAFFCDGEGLGIWVLVVEEDVCVPMNMYTQEAVRAPLPVKKLQLV